MRTRTRLNRGFTLIEILIVVVILGILAAIVIPQFTSASEDAQRSQVRSQLQTVRGQIELYNVDPDFTGYPNFEANGWDDLTENGFLQQEPRNSMRATPTGNATGVHVADVEPAADGSEVDAGADDDDGWVWNDDRKILYAIDEEGNVLDW